MKIKNVKRNEKYFNAFFSPMILSTSPKRPPKNISSTNSRFEGLSALNFLLTKAKRIIVGINTNKAVNNEFDIPCEKRLNKISG